MPDPAKQSLIRKIFGGDALSESNSEQWPQLAASWAGRQHEMPDEVQGVSNLRPMNIFERYFFGPTVNAATYPWGSIALNRENIEKNKVNMDNLLVHELTHVGQGQREGIAKSMITGGSMDMPDYEAEAYDAENNRYKKNRLTDIKLPNSNPTTPIRNTYPVQPKVR